VFSPKEKERDKHACMHMHVCMHVTTAAQPHLQGVRVCTTCASVCAATVATSLIHPLCLSLSVCTCTSVCPDACIYNPEVLSMCNKHFMLGQTTVIYPHTYTHNHTHSTLSLKHSTLYTSTRNTHTHQSDESPAKTSGGRADNWLLDNERYLYRGETER
jgi:hypothetical protein